jgi:hypothetical protein
MGKRMMHPIKSTKEQWTKMAPGAKEKALQIGKGDNVVSRTAKRLGQSGWTGRGRTWGSGSARGTRTGRNGRRHGARTSTSYRPVQCRVVLGWQGRPYY